MANSYHMLVIVSLVLLVRVSGVADECPPWFILQHSNDSHFPQCVCSEAEPQQIICRQKERKSFLKLGHCAFQDESLNTTIVGSCPYVFPDHLIHNGLIPLPQNTSQLNGFICGHLKREIKAPLCGRCTNGTGPSIYSFGSQCASCSILNILYYLLLQYAPATIIFLVILLFRFDIVSPPMAHYILYCNLVVLAIRSGIPVLQVTPVVRLVATLNAIWTFDTLYFLSPPLCISESIPEIYIPVFDAMAALYPFILLLLTYITIELYGRDFKPIVVIWKPCYKKLGKYLKSWSGDKSLIRAFATLFYLSFAKLIFVVLECLLFTPVNTINGDMVALVSYIDPTVMLFTQKRIPFITITIIIIISIIILPPILLLIIFPTTCFQKCCTCLKPRWMLTLQIFADTFQGCYKNGTSGTRDYRQMAGYILSIWVVTPAIIVIAMLITSSFILPWLAIMILVSMLLGVAILVLEPYQHRTANISGTLLGFYMALGSVLSADFLISTSIQLGSLVIVFFTIPHCVFYGYIIYHVIKRLRHYVTTLIRGEENILHRLVVKEIHKS